MDLIIIRGLPGSGKTCLGNRLRQLSREYVRKVEVDDFFTGYLGRPYRFDKRLLGAANDWCYGEAMLTLHNGTSVIVANNFSTRREIDRYRDGLTRSGIEARMTIIRTVGQHTSPHNVPASAIKRMQARWEDYPGEIRADTLDLGEVAAA
jgi:predicted kinase